MALPKWIPKPIRWIINRLDDPLDSIKEYLYNEGNGRVLWKWRIYFNCIMANKPGKCRIERI